MPPKTKEPEHWTLDALALALTMLGFLAINNLNVSFGLAFALGYSLNRLFFTGLMRYSRWAVFVAVGALLALLFWQGARSRNYDVEQARIAYERQDALTYAQCRTSPHALDCTLARYDEQSEALTLCEISRGAECP
jgi:hypothetical protein